MELKIKESSPIWLFVQPTFPRCPGKKAGAEAKKGREQTCPVPYLFISAKRRGGKGIGGLKRQKSASGKDGLPPFLTRRMIFCPGMGPFGHGESSRFAEPTENTSFSGYNLNKIEGEI